jgi:hypothetical protein
MTVRPRDWNGYFPADIMSEAQLQDSVRKMCEQRGLFHYHPYSSIRCAPGWPDSVIIGVRVIFRELKSTNGMLTREQRIVGHKLRTAGQSWDVWRPADLRSGRIERELDELMPVDQITLWGESA